MIDVAGMHTYIGGFPLGLKRGPMVKFHGTVETWKPPIDASLKLGLPHYGDWRQLVHDHGRMDLIIANPPCSRFSMMSKEKYSTEQKSDLSLFTELGEVVEMGLGSKASTIWWETGPLAFTTGRGIIEEIHNNLQYHWGKCTTIVMRIDLLHVGVPQRRLRTHVFHTNLRADLYGAPTAKTHAYPVGEWIDEMMPEDHGPPVVGSGIKLWKDPIATSDPVYFTLNVYRGAFIAKAPRVVDEGDTHTTSVLLDKNFAWNQKNRWWSVNEYFAIMGYDGRYDYAALNPSTVKMRTFCSKSVSPTISEWLGTNFIYPLYYGLSQEQADKPRTEIQRGAVNYIDFPLDKSILHTLIKHEKRT